MLAGAQNEKELEAVYISRVRGGDNYTIIPSVAGQLGK